MQFYSVLLTLQGGGPYAVLLELQIFAIKCREGYVGVLGKLLQEYAFPLLGLALQLETPFELLLLLAVPVSIVEFAIPCSCIFIFVCWHNYLPFLPYAGQRANGSENN